VFQKTRLSAASTVLVQPDASGKFVSRKGSAALGANRIGWFLDRPGALSPFPGLDDLDRPASSLEFK
jgi:hypothetical protein